MACEMDAPATTAAEISSSTTYHTINLAKNQELTFTPFPRLPPELREAIWKAAFSNHAHPTVYELGPPVSPTPNIFQIQLHNGSIDIPNPLLFVSHESREIAKREYDGCICACQTTPCWTMNVRRWEKVWKYAWFEKDSLSPADSSSSSSSSPSSTVGKMPCAVCEEGCEYRRVYYTKEQAFYWRRELTILESTNARYKLDKPPTSKTGLRLSNLPASTWVKNIRQLVLDASCSLAPSSSDHPSSSTMKDFLAEFFHLKKLALFRWAMITYAVITIVGPGHPRAAPVHPIRKIKLEGDELEQVKHVLRDMNGWPAPETWWGGVEGVEMEVLEVTGTRHKGLMLEVEVLGRHLTEAFEEGDYYVGPGGSRMIF